MATVDRSGKRDADRDAAAGPLNGCSCSSGARALMMALLLLCGSCIPLPSQPVRQDPMAGIGSHQAPAFPELTIAIVESENTKNAKAFGYQGSMFAGFDPQQLLTRITDVFRRNFKTAVRVDRIEDVAVIKPDLIAVVDVFVQAKNSFRMDVSAIILLPDKAPVDTIKSGGEKSFGMSGPGGVGAVINSMSQDVSQALEKELRNSRPVATFAQGRPKTGVAAAGTPQSGRSVPMSDIDGPVFGPSERIFTENDVAVVIGIERYQDLPAADYAANDAKLAKEYLIALGMRERNVQYLVNERATLSGVKKTVETWLPNSAKRGSRVVFYYSGHGAPEPASGDAYLVPFDGDPNYLPDTGYSLKGLYGALGRLDGSSVAVILDSCFSGVGSRSVLAKGARPIVIVAEGARVPRNTAVLAAAQGAQISASSPEKGHGILTYQFLKAVREGKKGLDEIYLHIKPLVEDEARRLNVQQSPVLLPGADAVKGRFFFRR